MRIGAVAPSTLGLMVLVWCSQVPAQPDPSSGRTYKLETESSFQRGCFELCACPVTEEPLEGTFELRHIAFDGLYDNYAVSNVSWIVPRGTSRVTIRGSGQYRVGGEVALREQMSLDLSVGGEPPQHFDSGLVPGGGEFPAIDIEVSVHVEPACFDSVIQVRAAPTGPTSVSEEQRKPLDLVVPNPFTRRAEMHLTLGSPGRVDLVIYDVLGRAVRHLIDGRWVTTGSHRLLWDGRHDDGSACAGGVYFVDARIQGHRTVARTVKAQ